MKNLLRKVVAFLAIATAVFAFGGCKQEDDDDDDTLTTLLVWKYIQDQNSRPKKIASLYAHSDSAVYFATGGGTYTFSRYELFDFYADNAVRWHWGGSTIIHKGTFTGDPTTVGGTGTITINGLAGDRTLILNYVVDAGGSTMTVSH